MSPGREREHKFLLDRASARRVFRAASRHLTAEVYDPGRPVAYARTLYLDTRDRSYLRSSDRASRVRVRLRQYAAALDLTEAPRISSGAFLEFKRTAGLERRKVRVAMSAEQAVELLRGRPAGAVAGELAAEPLLAEVGEALEAGRLFPVSTTWYRRMSLAGDGLRLTFDEAIAFCQPAHPAAVDELAEPGGVVAHERRTIVELKTRGGIPAWLAGALPHVQASPEYSKFRAAMAAVTPAAPTRRDGTLPLPVLS